MSLNTGFLRYEYTGINSFLSPYFDDKISNIEVKLNGVLVEYNFLDENKTYLEIVNTELNIGDIILINRITNSETRIVDYNNGSILSERDLDLDSNQLFYLIQETKGNIEENDYLDIENFNNNLSKDDFTIQKAFETLDKVIYAKIDNQVLQVDNINSLTEGNYDGETVFVKGYYTENDGGGGLFTYDETKKDINDGGLIINGWVRQISDIVNVKMFGAKGNGIDNDYDAIQSTINTHKTVFIPNGEYLIESSIYVSKNGQKIIGESKYDTVINNKENSSPLLLIGGNNPNYYGEMVNIESIRFKGNNLTNEGISIYGIVDDDVDLAARDVSLKDLLIENIGNGFSLRISAWEVYTIGITIRNGNKGIKIGTEANSLTCVNTYITNMDNECLVIPNDSGQPAVINFNGLTAQYSGGEKGMIDIRDGYAINFSSLYIEGSKAPNNIYIGEDAKNINFNNVMHNLVNGTADTVLFNDNTKSIYFSNFVNLGGDLENIVKIEGYLPLTTIESVFIAVGSATNIVLDNSDRKKTTYKDSFLSRNSQVIIESDEGVNQLTLKDNTGKYNLVLKDGKIFLGEDDEVSFISRSGSSINFRNSADDGYCNVNLDSIKLKDTTFIKTGSGSPENAVTANIGSLFLRTDGGENTTLYIKESDDGEATGWVAK
jgi:hypothetical protein